MKVCKVFLCSLLHVYNCIICSIVGVYKLIFSFDSVAIPSSGQEISSLAFSLPCLQLLLLLHTLEGLQL